MNSKIFGQERLNKIKLIKDNLVNLPDDNLSEIYDKLFNMMNNKIKKGITDRITKTYYIDDNLKYMDDEHVIIFENIIINCLFHEENCQDKMKRVVLEITNKLLTSMEKTLILDLCDFNNINRNELLSDQCKKIINDNKTYIFSNGFSKHECNVYQTKLKNPHISIFKGMLKQVGYELCYENKTKMTKGIRKRYTIYFIKKQD
jgi:hypothetical protein